MRNTKFKTLFIFYISYIWFIIFSRSILPTHFLKEGLTFSQMLIGSILNFSAAVILLLIFTKFSAKVAWRLAPIANFIYILLIIHIFHPLQFYAGSFIDGFSIYFFFVFYNIAHFEYTHKSRVGHSSGLLTSVGPVINILAPLLAGYLIQTNTPLFWVSSGIFFLITLLLVNKQEDFEIKYSIKGALTEIKSTRLFIFLEGIWEAMVFSIIPIFSLFFIKSPLNYGLFIAYLGLMGALATFLLGRFTDKIQKRSVFLYPITISMAIATFLFAKATNNVLMWIFLSGIIQFILPIFWNLSIAMVVDTQANIKLAMIGREFLLNSGRVIGLLVALFSFNLEKRPFSIFIILGLVMMVYAGLLFWRTKISKKYSYL